MILPLDITAPLAVPEGTTVITTDPLTVDLADYDYSQFADHPDGRIDRAATCTSHPGRHTTTCRTSRPDKEGPEQWHQSTKTPISQRV